MPLDDEAWKRLPYYAYYDAAPYYGNGTPMPTTSSSMQPPHSRPMSQARYQAPMPTPTPAPTTYPSYPPHSAYPASYPAPTHHRGTTAYYHQYPHAMPHYAVEPSRAAYPVAPRDVSMLTIPIYDSDLDEMRMLQEMLLTPYPGDDETKESSHVAMLLAANHSIALATTTTTTPTTTTQASAPTTPLSEVSSCDSQRISLASETSPRTSLTRSNSRARSIPPSRICRVPDCTKGIRSRGLCKAHGGGRRCQTPGCTISDQGGGHCIAHGGGKRCTTPGCDKSAQFKGLCKVHGGSRRCRVIDCDKNGQIKGLCRHHYTQSLQEQHHGSSDQDESDHHH